jgi:hypothetical protein
MNTKLIEAGWIQEDSRWKHPLHPALGTCSESRALKHQTDLERFASGLFSYELSKCSFGYGYVIYSYASAQSRPIAIFRHEDKEVAKQALEALNRNPKAEMELNGKLQPISGFFTTHQFPRLLILKEKHGDKYYHVPTPETLATVSLATLKQRKEEGWYPVNQSQPTKPELAKEQIDALPEGSIKQAAIQQHKDYLLAVQYHSEEQETAAAIEKAITTSNGKLACRILMERAGCEYEGFRLEEFDQVQ